MSWLFISYTVILSYVCVQLPIPLFYLFIIYLLFIHLFIYLFIIFDFSVDKFVLRHGKEYERNKNLTQVEKISNKTLYYFIPVRQPMVPIF